jgi:hypothetical protein
VEYVKKNHYTTFQELSGGKECEWLMIQSEWDDIFVRILGMCACHQGYNVIALGRTVFGTGLVLETCLPQSCLCSQCILIDLCGRFHRHGPSANVTASPQPKEAVTIICIPTSGMDKQERPSQIV